MKNKFLICLCILASVGVFAQKHYEKGHIVTVGNRNFNGYLLHEDLFHTPTEFYFKEQLNDRRKTINAEEVKTVVINPNIKYERHSVEIDFNNTRTSNNTRISNLLQHSLLLKVLLEGDITLLSYETSKIKRYFVKKGNNIVPLEYKKYKIDDKIHYNLNYQKQLRESFACQLQDRETPSYSEKKLIKYFKKYAKCHGLKVTDLTAIKVNKVRKGIFNLRAKVGVSNSTFYTDILGRIDSQNSAANVQYGVELEYVFPYNNHRFSVFVDPTILMRRNSSVASPIDHEYHQYIIPPGLEEFDYREFSYRGYELPVGLRTYWYTSDKSAITLHGGILFNIPSDDYIRYRDDHSSSFATSNQTSMFTGIGYDYSKTFSIEFRYNFKRNLVVRKFESFQYSDVSLRLGVNLL